MTDRYVFAVAGSRDYYPDDMLVLSIERLKQTHVEEGIFLRVGDAKGVDEAAVGWAKEAGIPYAVERADWSTEGKMAGHNRNARVLNGARLLLAFLHPKLLSGMLESSPGTCDAITQATDLGIAVHAHHDDHWLDAAAIARIVELTHHKWASRKEKP